MAAVATHNAAAAELAAGDPDRFFEQHIRPLLVTKCLKCHGAEKQEGQLRLDTRDALLAGGDSGPAVVPGSPADSLMIEAIKYESFEMPPTGQLSEQEIQLLEAWVAADAFWPDDLDQIRASAGSITEEDRQWWAFHPITKPTVPRIESDAWSRTAVDRFVYQRLAQRGMQPAPQADKVTLVRRLYHNLIGLPPTPEQIEEFLDDESTDALENLVDKLLDDPRYGEHWARYWLDIVRYCESDGWNQDAYRPHIWRYRDYVVNSFNGDKPYPQFVREQLAGDEIRADDPNHLIAAGYLRLGIYEYNQRDARSHWDDIMNEMTDVTADVFLGIGMACARCHDHKFDPILQKDYFKLRAFFEPVSWRDDVPGATQAEEADYRQQLAEWESATKEIRARIDELLKPYIDRKWLSTVDKFPLDIQACFHKPVEERTSWEHQMAYLVSRQFLEEGGGPLKDIKIEDQEQHEALLSELAAFDHLKPSPLPSLMTVTDFAGRASSTVIPGDREKQSIGPGFLTVLTSHEDQRVQLLEMSDSTGRRTALAEWIGRADNPLTMRVMVNRVWQHHFGQGLVPTPNDFGRMGQPPTHPELLDWLTVGFVESGWSIKQLQKQIVMSATWQQSTYHPDGAEYQAQDPAENLLWRARIRRLSAEQIRDAMLSASGELMPTMGGQSVDADTPRRSLYVKSFRNQLETWLHAFDAANGLKSIAQRTTTTTPTQALLLINGDYAVGQATKLAERLQNRDTPVTEVLTYAFRLTWGRSPTAEELQIALRFVAVDQTETAPTLDQERLIDFCHVLFNSNEFLYID